MTLAMDRTLTMDTTLAMEKRPRHDAAPAKRKTLRSLRLRPLRRVRHLRRHQKRSMRLESRPKEGARRQAHRGVGECF